jgi:hypothetical protein
MYKENIGLPNLVRSRFLFNYLITPIFLASSKKFGNDFSTEAISDR